MTKKEKIDILWKMMWLNFKYNFMSNGICKGLCFIYGYATDFRLHHLKEDIPELFKRKHIIHAYWWSYRGIFYPWWHRHIAICKTIIQLKKTKT